MSIIDPFSKLDSELALSIFRKAGDFGKLTSVCHLFHNLLKSESEDLYKGFIQLFGEPCLSAAIKILELENLSQAAKIDALFHTAFKNTASQTVFAGYNYHAIQALKAYMQPLVLADALSKIWVALLNVGPSELKTAMAQVSFGDDPFVNADRIRHFLKTHPSELSKVLALDLKGKSLKILPTEIQFLTHLRKCDLSQNGLCTLPDDMWNLTQLRDLRISNNQLTTLPFLIENLIHLENLQCDNNCLTMIPNEICKLQKLRTLNLSGNQLKALPSAIDGLQALNYLYLENNLLQKLPDKISSITYLVGLYLFNNHIVSIPETFCHLQHLKYLSLQRNFLSELPTNLERLKSLQALFVDDNCIFDVPDSICALKHLKILSIADNKISQFPDCMQKLNHLCFNNNRIGTLKVLNPAMSADQFREVYWQLGDKKWKECIDGIHHSFGSQVYDLGLHGRTSELGFLSSMTDAFHWLSDRPNTKIDADFYLAFHKIACSHFNGSQTGNLMGQEKVGVFRDMDDHLFANFDEPAYLVTSSAMMEFNELNAKLTLLFGSSFRLGDLILKSKKPQKVAINYNPLSRAQIKILFNYFLTEFYQEMTCAKGELKQIEAIARLFQRVEWLHPVRDGCGRVDTALLNYTLTCFGFNPVVLKFPYISSCMGLQEWTAALIAGMQDWRQITS